MTNISSKRKFITLVKLLPHYNIKTTLYNWHNQAKEENKSMSSTDKKLQKMVVIIKTARSVIVKIDLARCYHKKRKDILIKSPSENMIFYKCFPVMIKW
ncbi:conserved hypothetical protein [Xenorhabdus cabanillasii JM26]|uniref:Uncharacterized protein n=1 Tax=Xenorhabdus cabanillasii JM26 TaxID=1427517 RepID=W1J8T1_9GAMM|nr:conserved hypothetical protein [Xenorhabdus cabanillasii JM26]